MSKQEPSAAAASASAPASGRGLLSKVARFVRNPTVNWSELDAARNEGESQYSKQMLKEMIERKRRNDFVRRREFDQLRKLRNRSGAAAQGTDESPSARSSLFGSSVSSPDERADTLRKIDEIEAQMSHQWWKGKAGPGAGGPGQAPGAAAAAPAAARPSQTSPAAQAMAAALAGSPFAAASPDFAPTAPLSLPEPLHMPGAGAAAPGAGADLLPGFLPGASAAPAFSESTPASEFPHAAPPFVHDPDLEEAAIRFASADYAGAEAALREVLARREAGAEGAPASAADTHEVWLTLFDLFRATGQHEPFDALAIDYAARFHHSAPLWFSLPQLLGLPALSGAAPAGPAARELSWNSPTTLAAQSVATLQASLARSAQPWTLSWSRLSAIDAAAVAPLAELAERLCSEPVQLRFVGVPALQEALRSGTPSGDRAQDPQRWRLRMALLRLMNLPDEFEMAALDYCVTYEVSPPSWEPPRCSFSGDAEPVGGGAQRAGDAPDSQLLHSGMSSGFALSMPPGGEDGPVPALVGHIEGDAGAALEPLQALVQPGRPLAIACEQLVRIDFAAGGSVLNWAAQQQAAGVSLEFQQLHRLVAVFFNVIGINEHARIVPRSN